MLLGNQASWSDDDDLLSKQANLEFSSYYFFAYFICLKNFRSCVLAGISVLVLFVRLSRSTRYFGKKLFALSLSLSVRTILLKWSELLSVQLNTSLSLKMYVDQFNLLYMVQISSCMECKCIINIYVLLKELIYLC